MDNLKKYFSIKENRLNILSLLLVLLVIYAVSMVRIWFPVLFQDSDLANGLLYGKTIAESKNFLFPPVILSTETRILSVQLIYGIYFLFFDNYNLVQFLGDFTTHILTFFSFYYFLSFFNIKKYIIFLVSIFLFIPISWEYYFCFVFSPDHSNWIICVLFSLGISFRIATNEFFIRGHKFLFFLFMVLVFICGMQSPRMLVIFSVPFIITSFFFLLDKKMIKYMFINFSPKLVFTKFYRILLQIMKDIKSIFINRNSEVKESEYIKYIDTDIIGEYYKEKKFYIKLFLLSFFSLFSSMFGYLFWEKVAYQFGSSLPHKATINFSNFKVMNFFEKWLYVFKSLFVYNKISVFHDAFIIIFVITIVFIFIRLLFYQKDNLIKYIALLALVMSIITVFSMVLYKGDGRHFGSIYVFNFIMLVLFIFSEVNNKIKKISVISFCISFAIFSTIYIFNIKNKPDGYMAKEKPLIAYEIYNHISPFLIESNLKLGFSSFWTAAIITMATNGKVEMSQINITEDIDAGGCSINFFKWFTPKKLYDYNYLKNINDPFLLITEHDYNMCKDKNPLNIGKIIYQKNGYVVLVYDNMKQIIKEFDPLP